jgi:hypothetical protein
MTTLFPRITSLPALGRAVAMAAIAAAHPHGSCRAQDIRITNMAGCARTQWVDVALPVADGAMLPELCRLEPQGFIAWKGAHVGLHSTMFHVLARLSAHESLTGRLVGVSSSAASAPPFSLSDWVDDDSLGVIPVPSLVSGGREHRLVPVFFREVESNPARKVLHQRGRFEGMPLVFDQWLYVYAEQDVVRFESTVTFSDPRTSALTCDVDLLWFETGEPLRVDYASLVGVVGQWRQTSMPWHPSFGRVCTLLSGSRTIGRGEQLSYSGSVLGLPGPGRPLQSTHYSAGGMTTDVTVPERIETLQADLPALGVCTAWDGRWLAFGVVPEVPDGRARGGWDDADASADGFRALAATQRDLYVQRPRGLNRRAGSTGAQEDFGAGKGSFAVAVGDPRFLHEAGYSIYEAFARPFHYREADGSPLLARHHPQMRTWSQLLNCRTTQDTVGLVCPLPYSWPNNGWSGYDDQHRSQNNLNAQLALTGGHALRAALRDLLQVDLAQDRGRIDSPRGEGRLMMAWANMLLLLDDHADRVALLDHMSERVRVALEVWPGRNFVGDPTRPIRALGIGRDPTFRDPQGNQIPAIIVWEHGIAVMGYFAAWRLTGDPRFHDLAAELSRLIVNHCIFAENGEWIACTAVRYLQGADEGRALPASAYYTGSPDIHVGISFWTWIFPAVLVCRELHAGDPALVARCNAIVAGMGPPDSWQRSEWWAVLPR